ncbi:hypothetical protein T484DRAFT_1796004 [Baffinella frigidus]|nr:hypothetical protein T484DRAFT_1796004 [Cryptophyta sp. CCMP2293]
MREFVEGHFTRYDEDGDGAISLQENLKVDKEITPDDFDAQGSEKSFHDSDVNNDGRVDLSEFAAAIMAQQAEAPNAQCKEMFGPGAEFDGTDSCVCIEG